MLSRMPGMRLFPWSCEPWKQDGVCHTQLWGRTPQLPAKGSHTCPRPPPQPQACSQKQLLRAWWVFFEQKHREGQISPEKMLGSSTFTPLLLPRGSEKAGWLLQRLQSWWSHMHLFACLHSHLDKKKLRQALFYWKGLYFNSPYHTDHKIYCVACVMYK